MLGVDGSFEVGHSLRPAGYEIRIAVPSRTNLKNFVVALLLFRKQRPPSRLHALPLLISSPIYFYFQFLPFALPCVYIYVSESG